MDDPAALLAAARRAWPRLDWSEARLAELAAGAGASLGPNLDEVLLAWACLLGDAEALRTLEARYIADVVPNLDRLGLSAAERDEALQALRARLLLPGETTPPGLARFAGLGPLGGFVRTTAVRVALDQRRARGTAPRDEVGALLDLTGGDAELAYMRRLYAGKVEAALQVAWAKLTAEQRLLVRQQALDGLGIDQLATLHSVHRSTAARRCAAARAALVGNLRRELRAQLGAGGKTVESILHMFSSGLEAHLRDAAG